MAAVLIWRGEDTAGTGTPSYHHAGADPYSAAVRHPADPPEYIDRYARFGRNCIEMLPGGDEEVCGSEMIKTTSTCT